MLPATIFLKPAILKKTEEKKSFIDHDILQYITAYSSSINERMRIIDKFHFHSPVEQECKLLHIPDDRINILYLKELLFLCGGGVGVRFTSEDLHLLTSVSHKMAALWSELEQLYNAMDSSKKKLIVEGNSLKDANNSDMMALHDMMDRYLLSALELQNFVRLKQSLIASEGDDKG